MLYQLNFKNVTAFVKNKEDVFYWLQNAKAHISENMKKVLLEKLFNFEGFCQNIAIGNNSGNPVLSIKKVTEKQQFSIHYAQRIRKTFTQVHALPLNCEVVINLHDRRITFLGAKFFDKICGNGWMHSYMEYITFDRNGRIKDYTCVDSDMAKTVYNLLKK